MSLSATLFGRDSFIHRATNILGLGIPGWLDKKFGAPETEGPRLDDLSVQTSTYGMDIPRLYGIIAGAGNLIQLENNKLKEKVRKKKSGGKGGSGSSEPTTTHSYSATFQLALCEGPIAGVRRIWCGDKLIYNAGSSNLETIIASNKAAKGWRLYLGTDDQLPDPRYEAEYGVGNVSAHRGLAYIAFYDFQLADYSNTLQGAQFKVEVVTQSATILQLLSETDNQEPVSYTRCGGVDASGFLHLSSLEAGVVYEHVVSGSSIVSRGAVVDLSSTITSGLIAGLTPGAVSYYYQTVINEVNSTVVIAGSAGAYKAGFISVTQIAEFDGGVFYPTNSADCYYSSTSQEYIEVGGIKCYPLLGPVSLPEGVGLTAGMFNGKTCVLAKNVLTQDLIVYSFEMGGLVLTFTEELRIASGAASLQGFHNSGIWRIEYISSSETMMRLYDVYGNMYLETAGPDINPSLGPTPRFFDNYILASEFTSNADWRLFSLQELYSQIPLAEVIESEVMRSGLMVSSDLDTSLITDVVRGYRVSGGAIRAALEPLQAAYHFDVIASGYKVKCVPRGQSPVVTIPWEDLGATSGDRAVEMFTQTREMDTQLPARTVVKYMDAAREYAITEQYSERLNTEAVNKVERELALVMTADEAAKIAEILNFLPWLERSESPFVLPPTYLALEPADVVTVETKTAIYELRLEDVSYTADGRLECMSRPARAALYTSSATGAEGVPPTGEIYLPGESLLILLDIPVVDETVQNAVGFVGIMASYSASWAGGLAVRSNDGGQTWADLQAFTGQATVGIARGTLPESASTLIDQRALIIDRISGEPESVTRDQMLAGVNYAAYGVNGRWEIVRFQNAVLQTDGSYLLSVFVRGDRGTEWATGLHQAGDYFVLLDDPDNAFIGSPVESISLERLYRGISSGAALDDASDVAFAYHGVNLECLSPVHALGSRDGSGNFSGSFTRRSRLSSSWWATGVPAPVGETSEAYEIDVMSGSTVKRTISSSTPNFIYSAADQSDDFGSTQASITFRIFQISSVVGRGYPLEVTL